jgi:hypothetical protein
VERANEERRGDFETRAPPPWPSTDSDDPCEAPGLPDYDGEIAMQAPSGKPYAQELARLADGEPLASSHLHHAAALAESLAVIHTAPLHPAKRGGGDGVERYAAATRRWFSGEKDTLAALDRLLDGGRRPVVVTPADAARLETLLVAWRARLRERSRGVRLVALADADAGRLQYPDTYTRPSDSVGEAAADLAPIAMRYLALGCDDADAWTRSFRPLWNGFFTAYFARSGDAELLDVAPPFFAVEAVALAASGTLRRNAETRLVAFALAMAARKAFDPDVADAFVERDGAR